MGDHATSQNEQTADNKTLENELTKTSKSTGFECSGSCSECEAKFDTSSHRAIQEACGHVKCRPCFIKNENGCLQCTVGSTNQDSSFGGNSSSNGSEIAITSSQSQPSDKCLAMVSLKDSNHCSTIAAIDSEKQKSLNQKLPKWSSRNKYLLGGGIEAGLNFKSKTKKKEKQKGYQCELCDRRFPTKSYFDYHTLTHTGERPYQCTETGCQKSFKSSYQLSRHVFVHNGESNYVCRVCDKRMMTKDALVIHLRNHSNEKPFACDKCDKKYPSQANLNRHAVTHAETKDFLCVECGKVFMSNGTLSTHMLSHIRERDFPCQLCRYVAKRQIDLDRHQLSHRELNRIPCPLQPCKRRFRRKDNLIRHLKLSHDLSKEEANKSLESVNFEPSSSLLPITGDENNSESDDNNVDNSEQQVIDVENEKQIVNDGQEIPFNRAPVLSIDTSSITFPPNPIKYPYQDNTNTTHYNSNGYPKLHELTVAGVALLPGGTHLTSEPPKFETEHFNTTSVIRSVESLDPQYLPKRYNNPQQVVIQDEDEAFDEQPRSYSVLTNGYSTSDASYVYELSKSVNDVSNQYHNDLIPQRTSVIDNTGCSNLHIDVNYENAYPIRKYVTPDESGNGTTYIRTEYLVPVPSYHIPQEASGDDTDYSRSLIDLSFHNRDREVYSSYPDAYTIEQLNNQRISPSSRYPRINYPKETIPSETVRPENMTVIRKASRSYSFGNANSGSQPSKMMENSNFAPQESVRADATTGPTTNLTTPVLVIPREGRNTPSSNMNPTLNRDPRKNFLWENSNRINRD